jgi:hypothetical protein
MKAEDYYKWSGYLRALAERLEVCGIDTKQIRAVELRLSEQAYRMKEK